MAGLTDSVVEGRDDGKDEEKKGADERKGENEGTIAYYSFFFFCFLIPYLRSYVNDYSKMVTYVKIFLTCSYVYSADSWNVMDRSCNA